MDFFKRLVSLEFLGKFMSFDLHGRSSHEKACNLMSRACSLSMFTSFVEPITFMEILNNKSA